MPCGIFELPVICVSFAELSDKDLRECCSYDQVKISSCFSQALNQVRVLLLFDTAIKPMVHWDLREHLKLSRSESQPNLFTPNPNTKHNRMNKVPVPVSKGKMTHRKPLDAFTINPAWE